MRTQIVLFISIAMLTMLASSPAAHATAAGTGVRGSVTLGWQDITGSPITTWNGSAKLVFRPTLAARRDIIAAAADPALGEGYRTMFAPQVQAAYVTQLSAAKHEQEICTSTNADGDLVDVPAVYSTSVAGPTDGRVAFEIGQIRLDLIAGRGSVQLAPHVQTNSSAGDTGWWATDRWVLPGRAAISGSFPCPGDSQPSILMPRIFARNGGAVVPRAVSDWLDRSGGQTWRVKRTGTGAWQVQMHVNRRVTFSERPFGPQDTQQLRITASSTLYLSGSPRKLQARCKVPTGLIARSKSATSAVRVARRAGLTSTRYGGVRRVYDVSRPKYVISGKLLDTQGHAPCGAGAYRIHKLIPR